MNKSDDIAERLSHELDRQKQQLSPQAIEAQRVKAGVSIDAAGEAALLTDTGWQMYIVDAPFLDTSVYVRLGELAALFGCSVDDFRAS